MKAHLWFSVPERHRAHFVAVAKELGVTHIRSTFVEGCDYKVTVMGDLEAIDDLQNKLTLLGHASFSQRSIPSHWSTYVLIGGVILSTILLGLYQVAQRMSVEERINAFLTIAIYGGYLAIGLCIMLIFVISYVILSGKYKKYQIKKE